MSDKYESIRLRNQLCFPSRHLYGCEFLVQRGRSEKRYLWSVIFVGHL